MCIFKAVLSQSCIPMEQLRLLDKALSSFLEGSGEGGFDKWWRDGGFMEWKKDYPEGPLYEYKPEGPRFDMRVPTAYYQKIVGNEFPLNPFKTASYFKERVTDETELQRLNVPRNLENFTYRYQFKEAFRVKNHSLWHVFTGNDGSSISTGFHGPIDLDNLNSVLTFGFAPHRCRTGIYAPGTYFARSPDVPLLEYGAYDSQTTSVIMAVIAGRSCPIPPEPSKIPTGCSAFSDGEVFIVQDYTCVYPAYVLTFDYDKIR